MKLWTPNRKTVDPVPLCRRCGGFSRAWYRLNRHRAGFSFHRVCCCGCRYESVDLTLVGVEATLCGCTSGGSPRDYHTITGVDGTHNVPLRSDLEGFGDCPYFSCTFLEGLLQYNRYVVTGCVGGSAVETFEYLYLRVSLNLDHLVEFIEVRAYKPDDCSGSVSGTNNAAIIFQKNLTGSPIALGETTTNGLTCGSLLNACDGGTAEVNAA